MKTKLSVLLQDKGRTIHHISPTLTAFEAAQHMIKLNIGALLVMEEKNLLGIFSERDIIRKVIGESCDPTKTTVAELMTPMKDLVVVSPDTTVTEAMYIVTEKRIRHLPVLNGSYLEGLISIGDLTRWMMLSQKDEIDSLIQYIQS